MFGLINGVIIAGFKMNPFIVTLGMMGVARGAAKWAAGNQTVNYDPASPVNLAMNNPVHWPLWLPPMGVLLALSMALVFGVILNYTVFGRHIFAIGSNEATGRTKRPPGSAASGPVLSRWRCIAAPGCSMGWPG